MSRLSNSLFILGLMLGCIGKAPAQSANPKNAAAAKDGLLIRNPPAQLAGGGFYKKYADAGGIPVLSSEKVPDAAVRAAGEIVNYMLHDRPDLRQYLVQQRSKVMIMAATEFQTDLPEYRDMKKPEKNDGRLTDKERADYDKPGGIGGQTDAEYWNQRARGMGGIEVSCAEENLLGYKTDWYYGENIFVHEFAHTVFMALKNADPKLYGAIKKAYQQAQAKGLYKGQYAINTLDEYFAEGTQWWFWSNYEFYDGEIRVQSPEDLKAYDPELYRLLEQIYEGHTIPADVYHGKNLWPGK
jgi:hypothetical protein